MNAAENASLVAWLDRVSKGAATWADKLDPKRTFTVRDARTLDALARQAGQLADELRTV